MWMILPRFFAIIPGSTACDTTNGAVRLVAMMSSQSFCVNSTNGARRWMPALFTRMSIVPCFAAAAATPAATASRSVTSNAAVSALRPMPASFAAASASASGLRPLRSTVAPACAMPWAIAKPRPR